MVHGFYLRKEYPTSNLSKVLGKVREACSFLGGKSAYGTGILREMSFAYITVYLQTGVCNWIKTYLQYKIKRRKNWTLTF